MQDHSDNIDAAIKRIGNADIVVGIPSFNNERTIGHVVMAADAGIAKYYSQFKAVIINSDGGSQDGTREAVLQARVDDANLLMLSTPLFPVHRVSLPYHGIPGKGSAFRMIFHLAERLNAQACVLIDSDLRSATPEWIDLLLRPVLYGGNDFVAPYYHRHKYDGTITNSIVYPLTRSLYGLRVRQPIGGDFGVSRKLVLRYLDRDDWETDVARYGIDIWMSTIAMAERFRVCQSFLGAKIHDTKDPAADLSAMLQQVVGSVFSLMEEYEPVWKGIRGSKPVDLFGFRYAVGLDPVEVNINRMLTTFQRGCDELEEIWSIALQSDILSEIRKLRNIADYMPDKFHLEDELWVRLIYDFACACRKHRFERGHILQSLTPLYLARVASFIIESKDLVSIEVDAIIERVCETFEGLKHYLISRWTGAELSPGTRERVLSHRVGEMDALKMEVFK